MDGQKGCAESTDLRSNGSKHVSFKDCPLEEKVARLHAEVVNLRSGLQYSSRNNQELRQRIALLERHGHSPNGEVFVPMANVCENDIGGCDSAVGIDYLR